MRLFRPAEGPLWLDRVLQSIERTFSQRWESPVVLQEFPTASLPAAADWRGAIVYDTTTTGVKYSNGSAWAAVGGGSLSDGDKGDITVSASGATWTIDNKAVSLAKMADVATGTVFYRKTAATGVPEVQTLATLKTDLGLTGTNSGDQTSIVGITGTLAEFDAACTDANFLSVAAAAAAYQPLDTQLTDLAALSYASNTLKVVRVNAGETAFELATITAGDFSGPGSATDNAIVRFDGTGGKTGQNSAATVSDDGIIRSSTNSAANAVSVPLVNWVMLTADYTLTSSGSEQKAFNTTANGTLTLPTGVYRFKAFLYLTTMSGTSGNLAFDPIGAGTAVTDRWGQHASGIDNSTPLAAGARGGSASVTQQSPASIVTAGTGTGLVVEANGMFRISTGGTIIPSVTLVTAAAAVMKAGSYFWIEKVGESSETYLGAWT